MLFIHCIENNIVWIVPKVKAKIYPELFIENRRLRDRKLKSSKMQSCLNSVKLAIVADCISVAAPHKIEDTWLQYILQSYVSNILS